MRRVGGWCCLVLLGRFGGLARLGCFSQKMLIQAAMEELRRGGVAGAVCVVEAQCCRVSIKFTLLNSFS